MTQDEARVFESVARGNPRFVEILKAQLGEQYKVLEQAQDEVLLRRAQGHAACLRSLLRRLEPAPRS